MTSTVNSCISNGNCITSVCVIINITQNQNPLCDAYFRIFKYLLTQKCTSTFKSSPKQFNCLIFLNEIKTIKCENQIKSQIGTKNNEFWCVFFLVWVLVWIHFNEIHTCSSNHLYGSDAFPERGHCGDIEKTTK